MTIQLQADISCFNPKTQVGGLAASNDSKLDSSSQVVAKPNSANLFMLWQFVNRESRWEQPSSINGSCHGNRMMLALGLDVPQSEQEAMLASLLAEV